MSAPTETQVNPKEQLASLVKEMDQMKMAFLSESHKFVKSWYWECAEFYVTKNYDRTREIGLERLSQMKARIRNVETELPQRIKSLLGQNRFWKHGEPIENWRQSDMGPGAPKELVNASAQITSELTTILREFGYFQSDKKQDGPNPKAWSDRMQALIDRYRELLKKGLYLESQIRVYEENIKKQKARDLWNQA